MTLPIAVIEHLRRSPFRKEGRIQAHSLSWSLVGVGDSTVVGLAETYISANKKQRD